MKHVDKIANVAIIIAVAVFLTLVIRGEFSRRTSAPGRSSTALVGTTIIPTAGLRLVSATRRRLANA